MTKPTIQTDYATCGCYIDAVTELVVWHDSAEAAYDAATDQLDEWVATTDIEYELVQLIRRYLEKGDHPAEGICGIWDDKALPSA